MNQPIGSTIDFDLTPEPLAETQTGREIAEWNKGLGWGIVLGAIATNIVYLIILNI